jgi:hypothetical protein
MRASSASGFSIEVSFEDLGNVRQSFKHAPTRSREEPVGERPRPRSGSPKWPIVLCGLFATFAGSAAFAASPLGQHPTVRPHIDTARDAATIAWHRVAERVRL